MRILIQFQAKVQATSPEMRPDKAPARSVYFSAEAFAIKAGTMQASDLSFENK